MENNRWSMLAIFMTTKIHLTFHCDSRYYFQSSGCYPFSHCWTKGCLMFDPKRKRPCRSSGVFPDSHFFPLWFTQSQFFACFFFFFCIYFFFNFILFNFTILYWFCKGTGSYSFQDHESGFRRLGLLQKANYCRLFLFHYSWFTFGLMTLSWHMEPAE